MRRAGCIVHVWKISKANPGVELSERDVKRLMAVDLADWTDIGRLTTDMLVQRLRGMMDRRITAGYPLRYKATSKN